jgi:dihydrolipoamide dehydrogenase
VITATPVAQWDISRRSSRGSMVVLSCDRRITGIATRRMAERSFDVVVIGAGPAGEVAAGRLGEGGLGRARREASRRGECSYACMPSKALLGRASCSPRRSVCLASVPTGSMCRPCSRAATRIHDLDDSTRSGWRRGVELGAATGS